MSRLGVLLWRNLRAAGGLSRRLHDSVGRTAPPALPLERSEVSESSNHGARPLYMDVQATTPMDPRVLDTMLPYLTSLYGNPHSRTHAYGWEAEEAVEAARKQVADLIGADPREIVFTSGATESNNMAIKGVARFYKAKKSHVITTQIVSVEREEWVWPDILWVSLRNTSVCWTRAELWRVKEWTSRTSQLARTGSSILR
jgi:hypothetical protein